MSDTFEQDKLKDFTIVRNSIFKDYTLSAKAKGVACQLLSLPPTWDYSVKGLVELFDDGEASIRSALTELESHGYLRRERERDQGRLGKSKYIITDMLKGEKPNVENPHVGNSAVENRPQSNTKESNTEKSITNSSSLRSEEIYRELPENLQSALMDFEKMRKAIKKPITSDRARKMLLNRLHELAGDDVQMMIQLLDEAILHNWQTVYLPRQDNIRQESRRELFERLMREHAND